MKIPILLAGLYLSALFSALAMQQQLDGLSAFEPNKGTWQEAGAVMAEIDKANVLKAEKGQGILVNLPTKKNSGKDLVSIEKFGDMDLEMDIMVAANSNSGVYLMGQYEIQILDSWGKTTARAGDMGGIYERWDESKPDGQKGYGGHAPRQNVSRAPGVWQHLAVSFQAPRFDDQGTKTENAKLLSVMLNGVLIHENLELLGPTRGALLAGEIPEGPIRIQGDHGAVAFRNIKVTRYDTPIPKLAGINYEVYKGFFNQVPEYAQLTPFSTGSLENLEAKVEAPTGQNLIRYKANLSIPKSGAYTFWVGAPSGMSAIKVEGIGELPMKESYHYETFNLQEGSIPIEILVSKTKDWSATGLDFYVAGPGLRQSSLSKSNMNQSHAVDPILVNTQEVPMLRSFIELPDGEKLTHALSVSSPQKIHYSFDLSSGNLVQVWRGDFLDATPMWHERGNGVSKPLGAVVYLGNPKRSIHGTTFQSGNVDFNPKGYQVKDKGIEFRYVSQGLYFKDFIVSRSDGKGLDRSLSVEGASANKRMTIAEGSDIIKIRDGLYWIVDKGFYIQMDPKSPANPGLESQGEGKALMVSIGLPVQYSLLF